jgi:aromatic-L-amino-acid/L-tryptophan decarboxylase
MTESLDPSNWEEFRAVAHRIIDDSVDYLHNVAARPVWQPMPDEVRNAFRQPLPRTGTELAEVYQELAEKLLPYPMGNIHPRFWMWYMGSGNATGALGDYLAAIVGSNLGGGDHAAAEIDNQVVEWCREMVGFPIGSSGTLVSGGSMANIIGLTVARNRAAGPGIREDGLAALEKPLRFYGSDQLHGCHQKAVELLGLGNRALRRIASDEAFSMDIDLLRRTIDEDKRAGFKPACIIATAGTVNTGAVDDLHAIAAICREEDIWFHVDGCIGALVAIAPENRHRVAGIEAADSIALDPHKLLHAPFEVGCAIIRDAELHKATFATSNEYLEKASRGVAAANWLHELGLQTTRGFRALKVWMAVKEHGIAKFGRLIDQNIEQAQYLASMIETDPRLELMAPVNLNIVCFRYKGTIRDEEKLQAINTEIMLRLQENGTAAISDTVLRGRHSLRAAIVNHRTRDADLELLVKETVRIGNMIAEDGL